MRGLSGDFNTMPLKDLVVYLGNRLATGTLTLEHDGLKKQLVLDQGAIINASSSHPREYLGQFLMNLGKVGDDVLTKAFATQKLTNVYLGRVLVMTGAVPEPAVENALQLKFRETILEAFLWPDGTFTYENEVKPELLEGIEVRIPLIEIHKESDFRQSAWEQIRTVFPHANLTLSVNRENLAEPPAAGSIEEKVLKAAESGQTLREMALKLHATDYFLYQRLYALHRLGAVAVAAERTEEELFDIDVDLGLGDAPTAEQLLKNALDKYAENNLREAWALARRASQLAASRDASQLLTQLENDWHPDLALRMLGHPRVPMLILPPDEVGKLPVSAAERYLLSRIDGKRSLAGIVGVAPMREFEALVFIDRFVQAGWIKLD